MKVLKYFAILSLVTLLFSSCETYDDMKVDYSPVYPLCGEWIVSVTDVAANKVVVPVATLLTYNTQDNSNSQMWLRFSFTQQQFTPAAKPFQIRGKVSCSVANKSFDIAAGESNLVATNPKFVVTEGKVSIGTFTTTVSKTKTDEVSFKITTTLGGSTVYLVKGYRRTMWPEDEL